MSAVAVKKKSFLKTELYKMMVDSWGKKCGLTPVEYKVIVLPQKVEEKTKGGIVLPDVVLEKDEHAAMEGTLVAASPLAFTYEQWPEGSRKPEVGNTVIWQRYAGIRQKGADGQTYVILNDKDVVAIKEAADAR